MMTVGSRAGRSCDRHWPPPRVFYHGCFNRVHIGRSRGLLELPDLTSGGWSFAAAWSKDYGVRARKKRLEWVHSAVR